MEALFNVLIALGVFVVLGALAGVAIGAVTLAPKKESSHGKIPEEKTALRAFVRCSGGNDSKNRYTYADAPDCEIAASLYGGMTSCRFACLGFGNCKNVCKNGAISIKNGVAVVDAALCDGCGRCAEVCPRSVIAMIPKSSLVAVACRNTDAEYELDRICDSGCIGCRACANTCEYDAIGFEEDLAFVDYEKCTSCGLCAASCNRGVISAPEKKEEPEVFDESEYFEISEELEKEGKLSETEE